MALYMFTHHNQRSKSYFENYHPILTEETQEVIDYQTTPYAKFQLRKQQITDSSNKNKGNPAQLKKIGDNQQNIRGILSKYIVEKININTRADYQNMNNHQYNSKFIQQNIEKQMSIPKKFRSQTTQTAVTFRNLFRMLMVDPQKFDNQILNQTKPVKHNQNKIIKKDKTQLKVIQIKKINFTPFQKLKIRFTYVRAVIRLSKNYRSRIQKEQYQQIIKQREEHIRYINRFQLKEIEMFHRRFVELVVNKILYQFKEPQYIQECTSIWGKEGLLERDLKRTRFCLLSLILMQNLVNFTQGENLPVCIQHQINYCLFLDKQRFCSKFVFNRTNLFSQTVTNLSITNKLLIVTEYFFFEIIIPNFLNIVSELKTHNISHHNQTLYYCASMIFLLQSLFTNHFRSMGKIIKLSNVETKQTVLKTKTDVKSGFMLINIEYSKTFADDETKILQGFFKSDAMAQIFKDKPKWCHEMKTMFEQILNNLQTAIEI